MKINLVSTRADSKFRLPGDGSVWVIALILFFGTLALYHSAFFFNFLAYDDSNYVWQNYHVYRGLSPSAISWAFTTGHSSNWHPLTWLSHELDSSLFGVDHPGGHHFVSVLIHAGTTVLVFLVLRQYTGARWRSALVAAWFGWHPLHVESVAWIAERKDVLCAFFWLLGLGAYYKYAHQPTRKKYGWVLLYFVLGLLSKPMMVTFPFVLLLLDYWPLKRALKTEYAPRPWVRLVVEKIPLFILSAASCLVTVLVQHNAEASLAILPFSTRLVHVLVTYQEYIRRIFWPRDLVILYPLRPDWSAAEIWGSLALILAITGLALWRLKRSPWLAVGWFWYLGTLVPVIGLVQVGMQASADRYTYLPSIGIFIALLWGLDEFTRRWPRRNLIFGVSAVASLLACAALTDRQLAYWPDTQTLFEHDIAVMGDNDEARASIGAQFSLEKRYSEALAQYLRGIELTPRRPDLWYSLGVNYAALSNYSAAITNYHQAVELGFKSPDFYYNLANAQVALNESARALTNYQYSLKLEADHPDAYNNLGALYLQQRRYREAAEAFKQTLRLDPEVYQAHDQLAAAYERMDRADLAMVHYKTAIEIKPDFADAHLQLGRLYALNGALAEAVNELLAATRLDPANPEAFFYLGAAQSALNRYADAAQSFSEVVRLKPSDAEARTRLAEMLVALKKPDAAIAEYQAALKIQPERVSALSGLAWVYATAVADQFRNGPEALIIAQRAVALSHQDNIEALSALDAACAENGKFAEAILAAKLTQEKAETRGQKAVAAKAAARILLYQQNQPYRE